MQFELKSNLKLYPAKLAEINIPKQMRHLHRDDFMFSLFFI